MTQRSKQSEQSQTHEPIAVVGLSVLFPGSTDARGFWKDILEGKDLIREVPESHWLVEDYYDPDPAAPDKTYGRRGAYLEAVPFAPLDHGIPPSIVPATDTAQLLALIVAQQVLEDAAQGQFADLDRDRISVILGATSSQELLNSMVSRLQRPVWEKALRESDLPESKVLEACERISDHYVPWQESTFPGLLGNVIAGRIANRLDLGGTNCVTDAACASSFAAISMAADELLLGRSDLVITGGVDTMSDIFMQMCFSKTPALSPTGDCRPFSNQADGTILGEGLGMVALRRLGDAERDGDRIYALLRGMGSSSDGRAKSVYAPVPEGQAKALRRAYDQAGYGASTVELVEAHGTGTEAGDAAEFEGLSLAFDASGRRDRQWCAVGSVKSQIGHTKAAAGAAGLFKAVMALHHGVLPPTIKVDKTNPKMDLESSPFYVNTEARPWVRGSQHPRRASVSSFGFGGSNFHLTLEAYQGKAPAAWRQRTAPTELVLFGGDSPEALRLELEKTDVQTPGTLRFLARESQLRLGSQPTKSATRLAMVAATEEELAARMAQVVEHLKSAPEAPLSLPGVLHYATGAEAGDVAFLFPGQGSQYLNMGADLAMTWSQALGVWDEAADLALSADTQLHQVVFPRPAFSDEARAEQAAMLTSTQWAQPALGVSAMATLELLRLMGLSPQAVGGHSFGEITALYASGVLDRETALKVARRRGELMHEAASIPGAMTAVVADIHTVSALVAESGLEVVVANDNAPRQVVLSGPTEAIKAMEALLDERELTTRRLPVATAFHSSVVSASTEAFADFLAGCDFSKATVPVYANSLATPYPAKAEDMRETLAQQIAKPVRFVEQLEAMYAAGVRSFIEVGPGSVLTRLVGQIFEGRPHHAIATDQTAKNGVSALNDAMGRMHVAGLALELEPLWAAYAPLGDPRLEEAPAFTLPICGSNYGKPYPPPGGAADRPQPNPEAVAPPLAAAPAQGIQAPTALPAAPTPAAPDPAWLHSFQELQRQTFESHTRFQEAMTRSHEAFLATAQASLTGLHSAMTGAAATGLLSDPAPPASPPLFAPAPLPVFSSPIPPPRQPSFAPMPAPPAPAAAPMAAPPAPAPLPSAPLAAAAATPDLSALLLEVVADKTGYPLSMLGMHMALEGDLGVDSIKRVEILAEIRGRVPNLPQLEPTQMVTLETLGEIDSYIQEVASQSQGETQLAVAPEAPASAKPATPERETPERETTAVGEPTPVGRHLILTEPAPALGLAMSGLAHVAEVLITRDDAGVADALVPALERRGLKSRALECREIPGDAEAVVYLGGLGAAPSPEGGVTLCLEALSLAHTLASAYTERGGVFLLVQDTGGDFGLGGAAQPWLSGLAGLARTAALEWPEASVRIVDMERGERSPEALAEALADELVCGGMELEVGLRADGSRLRLSSQEAPASGGEASLAPDSVYVVSGGGRGVTAACLLALAKESPGKFLLIGRTVLDEEPEGLQKLEGDRELKAALLARAEDSGERLKPAALAKAVARIQAGREIRQTLRGLEATGSEARYASVDVTAEEELSQVLQQTRERWGAITGLIHGAGVLADKLIAQKTQEQAERVLATKVMGLQALLQATSEDPLRFIGLFSSVAARRGNRGQSDYAMANEILNKVAWAERRRRGSDCLVKAFGWGPWEGGMVTPELAAHFRGQGVPLIPLSSGTRMMVDELLHGSGDEVELVIGAPPNPAGLSRAGKGKELCMDLVVSRASHPYLADHSIDGTPVVPVVFALEWFARLAEATWPGLDLLGCRDLKVLRGIRLEGFEEAGDRFTLRSRQLQNGDSALLEMELLGADGTLHYRAQADMGRRDPSAAPEPLPQLELEEWTESIYGGLLFHGPDFQVIRSLDGVSKEGMSATMKGVREAGWAGGWLTDAAALDGGLQMTLLWLDHVLGGRSLPTSVAAYRPHMNAVPSGPVRCTLRGHVKDGSHTACDLVFTTDEGALVAELIGVETHRLPGSSTPAEA